MTFDWALLYGDQVASLGRDRQFILYLRLHRSVGLITVNDRDGATKKSTNLIAYRRNNETKSLT